VATHQVYYLTEGQLAKLVGQGTYPGAQEAWDLADAIKKRGGEPSIYHSAFDGFSVIDGSDPANFARNASMRAHARPFPG
jgi:hypothetical protein